MFNMVNPKLDLKDYTAIPTDSEVPKELDVFCRSEGEFYPVGKTLDNMTDEEKKMAKLQYRFDFFKPGVYQGITASLKMGQSL